MTIQTTIINSGTIILASDLRATIDESKSYVGVRKIFELDNDIPIGIMINGLMDFEKIPMETLIGEFNERNKNYTNVKDIRDDFIDFLSKNTNCTPIDEYLKEVLNSFKIRLTETIDEYGFENVLETKISSPIPDFIKKYNNFNHEFTDMIPKDLNIDEYNLKIWEIFSHELNYEGTGVIMAGFDKGNHFASFFVFNIL